MNVFYANPRDAEAWKSLINGMSSTNCSLGFSINLFAAIRFIFDRSFEDGSVCHHLLNEGADANDAFVKIELHDFNHRINVTRKFSEIGSVKCGRLKMRIDYFHCVHYVLVPELAIDFSSYVLKYDLMDVWKHSNESEMNLDLEIYNQIRNYHEKAGKIDEGLIKWEIEVERSLLQRQAHFNALKAAIFRLKAERSILPEIEKMHQGVWREYKRVSSANKMNNFAQSLNVKFELEKTCFNRKVQAIKDMIDSHSSEMISNKIRMNEIFGKLNAIYIELSAKKRRCSDIDSSLRGRVEGVWDRIEAMRRKLLANVNLLEENDRLADNVQNAVQMAFDR